MRLGLLGGSFDPPHVGHLLMAQDALDVLSLDRLVIVPAARQPLKSEDQTPAAHRLAMVQAGFAGVPGIGGDVVPTLPRWKDVDRLLRMVQLVVLSREVADASPGPDVVVHGGVVAQRLATRRVDVSSTEIRARVRSGRSIRGFVPDAVATYIASTGLYREKSRVTESAESSSGA